MREVHIFGLPATVIEDTEEDYRRFQKETGGIVTVICTRVADAHWMEKHPKARPWPALLARRIVKHCVQCDHRIWVDPKSVPKGVIPVNKCTRCIGGAQFAAKLDEIIE